LLSGVSHRSEEKVKRVLVTLLVIGLAVSLWWIRDDDPSRLSPTKEPSSPSTPGTPEPIAGLSEDISEAAPTVLPGSISGMVLSADDRSPLAGVTVTGEWEQDDPMASPHRLSGISDGSGRYTLSQARPGRVLLEVHGDGWADVSLTERTFDRPPARVVVEPGRNTKQDILVVRTARLEGTVVTHDGTPVAGVEVHASINGLLRGICDRHQVQTDEQGRFVIENMIPGFAYSLNAESELGWVRAPARVRGAPGETVVAEIRLPPACELRVLVREAESDLPIVGAEVSTSLRIGKDLKSAVTDQDGVAELSPVPPGNLRVTVSRRGYATEIRNLLIDAASPAGRRVSITTKLCKGVDLGGMVRFSEGDGEFPAGLKLGAVLLDGPAAGVRQHLELNSERFVLLDLRPGTYELSLWQIDWLRPLAKARAETGSGEVILTVDGPAVLPPFELTILGPDEQPVAEATCFPRFGHHDTFLALKPEQGELAIELGRDRKSVELEVIKARGADGRILAAGWHGPFEYPPYRAEIRLRAGRTVSGAVVDEDGAPIPDVGLWAYQDETIAVTDLPRRRCHAQYRTGEDGIFRLDGLGSGSYWAWVAVPAEFGAGRWIDLPEGKDTVDLELRRGRTVTITVLDFKGKPVPGAAIRALGRGRAGAPGATTDANGHVVLEGVDPEAPPRISVSPPPSRNDLQSDVLDASVAEDVTVTLGRLFVTRGAVLTPDGRPVPNASIWLCEEGGNWGRTRSVAADGTFTIRGTDPRLQLLATPKGASWSEPGAEEVSVVSGRQDVKLIVDPGLELRVHVPGLPTPCFVRAELVCEQDAKRTRHAVAFAPEPLRFYGLEADRRYTLRILSNRGSGLIRGGVFGDAESLEVELGRVGVIRAKVTLPTGAERATGYAASGGLSTSSATRPDGSIWFSVLPGMEWTIRLITTVDGNRFTGTARGFAGDELQIELKPDPR
jgi:Carboxypeptidase regulatory-like domain